MDLIYTTSSVKKGWSQLGDDFDAKNVKAIEKFYDKDEALSEIRNIISVELKIKKKQYMNEYDDNTVSRSPLPFWDKIELHFVYTGRVSEEEVLKVYDRIMSLNSKSKRDKEALRGFENDHPLASFYFSMTQVFDVCEENDLWFTVKADKKGVVFTFYMKTTQKVETAIPDDFYGQKLLEYEVGNDLIVNVIRSDNKSFSFDKMIDKMVADVPAMSTFQATADVLFIADWEPGDPVFAGYETETRRIPIKNTYELRSNDIAKLSARLDLNEETMDTSDLSGLFDNSQGEFSIEKLEKSYDKVKDDFNNYTLALIYPLVWKMLKKEVKNTKGWYYTMKVVDGFPTFFISDKTEEERELEDAEIPGSVAWLENQGDDSGGFMDESVSDIEESNMLLENAMKEGD